MAHSATKKSTSSVGSPLKLENVSGRILSSTGQRADCLPLDQMQPGDQAYQPDNLGNDPRGRSRRATRMASKLLAWEKAHPGVKFRLELENSTRRVRALRVC